MQAVTVSGEAKKPIRVVIEVVRDKPLPVPAAPDKPELPGELKRLPFRAGDEGGPAPIDIALNDGGSRRR